MRTSFFNVLSWLLVMLMGSFAVAEEKKARGTYSCIEITRFDIREGVQFPPDYQISLMEDLIEQLEKTNRFEEVLRPGEQPPQPDAPTLQLTGAVTEFKAGSQPKRYWIGFGVGATKVVAQVRFVDRATGEVLLDRKVDGKVVMGYMGGESIGATKGLAKEVAKVVNRQLSSGVPVPSVKTYTITLPTTLQGAYQLGTATLKPGEYRLKVAGSKVVLTDLENRKLGRMNVRVENSNAWISGTGITRTEVNGNMRITQIYLGGSNTKLVFD